MTHLETFESAAKFVGIDPNQLPEVSHLPERFQKATIAQYKLAVISEAAWKKEDQVIDWYNWNQYKYYPWWDMSPENKPVGSASGFSFAVVYHAHAYSYVGSRLVYPTRDIAKYVANQHIELYRDLMVIA